MKKLIRCSADLSNRSVDQVDIYCKKYIQNIANECFESPVPEVIESEGITSSGFEIQDGSVVRAPGYTYEIKLDLISKISVYVRTVCDNDEFLGFPFGEIETYTRVSKFSHYKFGIKDDDFYKRWYTAKNHGHVYTINQIQDEFVSYDSVEDLLPRSTLLKIFKQFEQDYQSSKQMKSERPSITWKSLVKHLTRDDYDPDEQDEYTEFLDDVCQSIEDKMGLYVEPSVQGGQGGVWIYDNDTNETLVENHDYETFNEVIIDLAINSSSKKEFITKYKNYLEGLTE